MTDEMKTTRSKHETERKELQLTRGQHELFRTIWKMSKAEWPGSLKDYLVSVRCNMASLDETAQEIALWIRQPQSQKSAK